MVQFFMSIIVGMTVAINNLNSMQTTSSVNLSPSSKTDLETLRRENSELAIRLQASEQQRLIGDKKIQALEAEMTKLIKERHEFVLTIEAERTERLKLIQTTENLKNQHNLHDAETHKFQSLSRNLGEENESLKSQLQTIKLEKVALLKQKQDASNKLLLAESKLEAVSMQQAYANAYMTQLVTDNQGLRDEVEVLNKKLRQNSSGYVKTILKDSNQTKKQLLTEFEEKIQSRQMANLEETQRYEAKIAQLNLRVAQLESQIVSK